ncbi:hypothetical protein SAMN04487869_12617 [Marinobacter sp. DSM 26671]|uniref:hypothetical protein n=1 Tax=Marinobacter sp. DSM 26671 TaxID=1761793 RepID=UPI0008EC49D4|nr:hypothetical protein [Marinobacter sp. DSM 26671]SFE93382.1 hypothetical protein SAMN04487869_12617 [Marinobacter sp. DSM 26671]|tara:strand:+ start:3367 stop:4224 length:858 start_codon:yes stop_codon:yes gene_type:complete
MTTSNVGEFFDTSVLVLHPSSAPSVFAADGALEFEEESSIALPMQKKLKDAMVVALSDFAKFRKTPDVALEFRLRVESQNGIEFPATHVVRLIGPEVVSSDVSLYRAAARFILAQWVKQRSLDEQETEHLLSEAEKAFLKEVGEGIAANFAGRSISRGFVVRFGMDDLGGLVIQGVMPSLTIDQAAQATVLGVGGPLGFDEVKGSVTMWISKSVSEDLQLPGSSRVQAQCHDLEALRVLAQAYANRNEIEFKALVQQDASNKKPVITILELKEVPLGDPDQFHLE